MSKIKKCLLLIIVSIMSLIVFQGESKAEYYLNDLLSGGQIGVTGNVGVGSTVYINPGLDLLGRKDVYCVQYHTGLNSKYYPYYVEKYVLIEGNYGTWWGNGANPNVHIFNPVYGKVAYILEKGKTLGSGYGSAYGSYTPTQLAIYHTIGSLDTQFNASSANQNAVLTEAASQLIAEGTAYASSIEFTGNMAIGDDGYDKFKTSSGAYINDKTNKENVEVVPYEKDGTAYMRIGPFNWEFNGNITATSVKSDDGEIKDVLYSKYVGENEVFIDKTEIASLENFYITIKTSTKHTKIKSIDATVEKKSSDYVRAEIWLLSNTEHQNLMLARSETVPGNDTPVSISFDYDIKLTKSIKIVKVDDRNEEIPLSGVGFILKNLEMNKYVRVKDGEVSYVESEDKATEFITNKKGKLPIDKYELLIGTYEAIETLNPNYGYVLEEQETTIIDPDYYDTTIITNHQRYVKLSGFIWQDIQSSKSTVRNDLYKTSTSEYTDDKDEAFDGITVRLKSSNGQIVTKKDGTKQECVSSERGLYSEIKGGEYIFEEIEIEELSLYYVEFEYDGLIYQSVALPKASDLGKNNVSKATDVREREILDKNFTRVDATGENRVNVNNGTYSITYNDTVDHATSIKDSSDCILHARTDDAKLDISNYFEPTMEEIRYINLGLYEKPQADLALAQDLEKVTVGVNGYQHVYNYGSRSVANGTSSSWNVGVKFKNSYTGSYKRAIYKADAEYESEDKNKELQVKLTYKIAIRNESSYLTRANSIVDYFDNRYTLIAVGTGLDENNNVTNTFSLPNVQNYNGEYQKFNIDINSVVKAGESNYIYVQFNLNKDAVIAIMNGNETLYNKAEITSYTVFKDNKENTVAAVDGDSVPGNTNIDNIDTYEDDTDSAPPIQLELTDARAIQGTVFEDNTTVLENGTRQGNGIYDEGENTLKGVEVKMTYIGDTAGTNIEKERTTVTGENGDFNFSGYIPGQYTIVYTWGDKTYTVQDYKGTVYDSNRNQNDMYWYKTDVDTRKTDAIDDYNIRLNIDSNMAEITDATIYDEIEKAYKGEESKIKYTKMDSTTPTMEFSVEYDTNVTDGTEDKVEFIVKNVDFGIAERAKQQLDMAKRVKSFKITLANGQVLVDATVDEKGNLQGSHDHVTYMGPNNFNGNKFNGYIKAEMDSELIEGSTLEIGYEIKFINNSEVDYMTENYYKYGTIGGPKVTLTPSAVVDYLDKDLAFDASKNPDWEQLTIDGLKDKLGVENIEDAKLVTVENYPDKDILNTRTILYTESTAQPIEPGGNSSVELNVSKLVTTSDDLTFDNDAETVRISKPGNPPGPKGRPPEYFPEDPSEEVEITPSTGDDRAYVIPTIVGITSLLILSIGIFVIKKTVIDNK